MKLIQKKLFQSREFIIQEKGVYLKMKQINEYNEWFASYEELGFKKVYKHTPRTKNYIASGITGFIFLLMLILYLLFPEQMEENVMYINLMWGVFAILFLFVGRKDEIYLIGGAQDLAFFRKKPDEETVEKFINLLIEKAKGHLKNKYAKIDKDLNDEIQLNNFYWLRNIEVINDEEFEKLKIDLKTQKLM